MHTTFTPDIARQIVSDRVRAADASRLARKVRGRGRLAASDSANVEPVVRRAEPRAARFTSDIIGAR